MLNYLPAIAGVLVILDVIAVYLYSVSLKSRYPPSNPWSGITLAFLAIILLYPYLQRDRGIAAGWLYVVAILAVLSASLWTVAAMGAK